MPKLAKGDCGGTGSSELSESQLSFAMVEDFTVSEPCRDRVWVGRRVFSYIGDNGRNLKFIGRSEPHAPDSGCTMGR